MTTSTQLTSEAVRLLHSLGGQSSSSRRGVAIAVETTVLAASSARFDDSLGQGLACAVQSNRGVVHCDARLLRIFGEGLVREVDGPQHAFILGLQSRGELSDASTDNSLDLCLNGLKQVSGGPLERRSFDALSSSVINQRVAQQAVKPRDRLFLVLDTVGSLDAANERGLQNLLGFLRCGDPWLEESEEAAMILNEHRHHVGRDHAGELFFLSFIEGPKGIPPRSYWVQR